MYNDLRLPSQWWFPITERSSDRINLIKNSLCQWPCPGRVVGSKVLAMFMEGGWVKSLGHVLNQSTIFNSQLAH